MLARAGTLSASTAIVVRPDVTAARAALRVDGMTASHIMSLSAMDGDQVFRLPRADACANAAA